jgi:hypothetical protein
MFLNFFSDSGCSTNYTFFIHPSLSIYAQEFCRVPKKGIRFFLCWRMSKSPTDYDILKKDQEYIYRTEIKKR